VSDCRAPQTDLLRDAVELLARALATQEALRAVEDYVVPRCVVEETTRTDLVNVGNPYGFYRHRLAELSASPAWAREDGTLSERDVMYLTFLRTFAAVNGEIGTPLKQIAFLPVLRRLGVTVLLSLPTGQIGRANRKGSRGSPFAVANPFVIDDSLVDPLLPNVNGIIQYRAMVGAYAMAGIRCGSITPLTTVAMDSDLIGRFPELTYWWRMPVGSALSASPGTQPAGSGAPDVVAGISPDLVAHFTEPPDRDDVRRVPHAGAEHWQTVDGLTPASACPDVVGDETGTYSWADVAAVRFDDSIAPRLGVPIGDASATTRSVQLMGLVIAWRAAVLGERIFWIDVAARVPTVVLELACALFERWDGDSDRLCRELGRDARSQLVEPLLDQVIRGADSEQDGSRRCLGFVAEELFSFDRTSPLHDAIVGPWIFCVGPFSRDPATLRQSMRHHLQQLAHGSPTAPFLAGLGDHDAIPPAAELVAGLLTASLLLPGGVPLIFSGLEHGSQVLVNREFGFNTTVELRTLRGRLDETTLALFNDVPMPWATLTPSADFAELLRRLLRLRELATEHHLTQLVPLSASPAGRELVGYQRHAPTEPRGVQLTVYLNAGGARHHQIDVPAGHHVVLSTAMNATPSAGARLGIAPFGAVVLASAELPATQDGTA
jgi:hypothetical protein